jgi:hypothetical protein
LFGLRRCWVFLYLNPHHIILTGTRDGTNSLYRLTSSNPGRLSSPHHLQHLVFSAAVQRTTTCHGDQDSSSEVTLWHQRTGHLNFQSLYHLSHWNMVTKMPILPLVQKTCDACIMEKQHRQVIPKIRSIPTTRSLELIHTDLCGPLLQKSLTGSRYILTFIDDYTRRSWVYFLATKDEIFECFKYFKQIVENETNSRISYLRTDRGGKYMSTLFISYCRAHGIHRQLTTAGTPQQNDIAEHKNQHLLEMTHTLLFGAHLHVYFWEEAIRIANYLSNSRNTG